MNFSISGFGRTQADSRNTIPTQDNRAAVPRKSVVQVQFPCFGHSLAYYNDQFDLHQGDRVYVDGKLEGEVGVVTSVAYNFKIKLSDYKRVIAVVDTCVHGQFYIAGAYCVTFDPHTLPAAQATLWFRAPSGEDEIYESGSDDTAFRLHEFYQVNTPAAEALYAKAREFAALTPDDFLLDLYCGMGTIGLSMLPDCRRLVGVEVVPQAVDGAKETAARLGLAADKADFRCQDAGAAAAQLAAEGARPDVIVVDPPRKGCDEATLTAIAEMAPRTVVMVSCNAATAARDTRWLVEHGYKAEEVQPVDLFPRNKHVECVVKLVR